MSSGKKMYSPEDTDEAIRKHDKVIGQAMEKARAAKDMVRYHQLQRKRALLQQLQDESRKLRDTHRAVFISFSNRMQSRIEEVKKLAINEFGFDAVYTGFDDDVRKARTLRTGIIYKIRESRAFLGVWNDDLRIVTTLMPPSSPAPD